MRILWQSPAQGYSMNSERGNGREGGARKNDNVGLVRLTIHVINGIGGFLE